MSTLLLTSQAQQDAALRTMTADGGAPPDHLLSSDAIERSWLVAESRPSLAGASVVVEIPQQYGVRPTIDDLGRGDLAAAVLRYAESLERRSADQVDRDLVARYREVAEVAYGRRTYERPPVPHILREPAVPQRKWTISL